MLTTLQGKTTSPCSFAVMLSSAGLSIVGDAVGRRGNLKYNSLFIQNINQFKILNFLGSKGNDILILGVMRVNFGKKIFTKKFKNDIFKMSKFLKNGFVWPKEEYIKE